MEDTWHFHSILLVGSLKDCIRAEEVRLPEGYNHDLLLTTQRCSPTTLKETAGRFIAMSWNHFFPEGSEGDAIMRQLPSSLWENILPHLSIISMGNNSPSLADALARVRNVCVQDEDIYDCLKGILLHEWTSSAWITSFFPDHFISVMSEETLLVYHRTSDWGRFDDFIDIYQGQKRLVFQHLKEGPITGMHDGEMPLVDSFLPPELGQYRNLLRPPREFAYHSKVNNRPPGYNWLASSRSTQQKRVQEEMNEIENLNKLLLHK